MLYDPNSNEDHIRGSMRSVAETARATERGLKQAAFLTAMDEEMARIGAPGSSWNDEERAKWEAEMRAGTVEAIDRAFGDPSQHANRAVDGMIVDDHRRQTGQSRFMDAFDREVERMAEHNSRAEHKQALAAEDAEEFRQTHTATGQPTTVRDGYDREHGGRYD